MKAGYLVISICIVVLKMEAVDAAYYFPVEALQVAAGTPDSHQHSTVEILRTAPVANPVLIQPHPAIAANPSPVVFKTPPIVELPSATTQSHIIGNAATAMHGPVVTTSLDSLISAIKRQQEAANQPQFVIVPSLKPKEAANKSFVLHAVDQEKPHPMSFLEGEKGKQCTFKVQDLQIKKLGEAMEITQKLTIQCSPKQPHTWP